jgi:hypothetical protein
MQGREQNTLRLITWGALGFTLRGFLMRKFQIAINISIDIAKILWMIAVLVVYFWL